MSSPGNRFKNNIVLITGSTRGIGQGIARRFADEGATVVVTGRTAADGKSVVDSLHEIGATAMFVEADMRSPTDIEALVDETVDEYGRIDVLVNNAGVQTETRVGEATIADWNRVVETDFRSFWLCTKAALDHMPAGSTVVNISSNHAYQTMPELFPYNAINAGIDGMTRAMALDFGPEIRVNTVNPGWIAVERTVGEMSDKERNELESLHPVGRIGRPEDIAGAVTFLASEDAAFITGTSMLVDGGRGAVLQDDTLPDYTQ